MKKRNVLLSSIITIVLCLSVVAGSTFALFTSEDSLSIEVTSGTVEIDADITNLQLWSVEKDDKGIEEDENKKTYTHIPVDQFTNGGTAAFDGALLSMKRITPGDKVTFNIPMTNTSDVKIQYRYTIECLSGYKLMDGLVVTINDTNEYTNMLSYTTPWTALDVNNSTDMSVAIELPVAAGNEYQGKETEMRILVEAVQFNADVDDKPLIVNIPMLNNVADIQAAFADPELEDIFIADDVAGAIEITGDLSNKTIWANENDVAFTFTGNLDNVTIYDIKNDSDRCSVNVSAATGNITILDSEFISASSPSAPSIYVGANIDVTVDNCTFEKGAGKGYAIRGNASGDLTVTNSEFYGYTSWAIIVNGKADGNVTVDSCYFNVAAGVFKTLGDGITGNFTFTNNRMVAPGDGGNLNKVVVSGSGNGPIICAGTVTDVANVLNGAPWNVSVQP